MFRWSSSSSMILASMILVLELVLAALAGAELSSRIVRTKYGELSGVIVTLDRYLEGVEVFRGVPYASPPIGTLRFMPPVSGALWHGVKVADKFGPVCPQKLPELTDKMPKGRLEYLRRLLPYLRNQSEDCLYLNIYAPVQGLLFHRGVLMSGSALSPWALVRGAANYAMQVAKHLNCSSVAGDPQALLRCLRDVPLNTLISVPVKGLEFAPAFGPSIDGVVIDPGDPEDQDFTLQVDTINTLNNILLRKDVVAKLSRYDLMVGVVRSEAYFSLTADDAQYGIEADRRTKILREFVRNTYTYHQPEILATIINEYTDWERPVQHPVNIRDETLEALGDANTVAPATRTADLHSQSHRNSYLYVFDYQTKFGDYPQRPGCIHGEELPYFFGAPIVGGLAHWPKNYTRAEIALSESVILYLTNFARTGNPNEGTPDPGPMGSRPERTKFKNIDWTAYEAVHKKYLSIELKSKLKNHYRAHRLSFWLNLVPDLHKPGSDDVPRSHHLLDAEQVPPRFIQRVPTTARTTTSEVTIVDRPQNGSTAIPSELAFEDSISQPEDGFAAYSTALSVTIAIGCSLLILNVLIFAGVYYQRDKSNQHSCSKKRQENGQMPNNICGELETKTAERHHIQHIPPPEFADLQNNTCHVPMPPPPPKNTKPGKPTQNLIISPNQLQQESLAMSAAGTLKKGHNHQQQIMEELRV
ncbi:neuroligin-4, X-linked isoform X2 [Vespa velutina]|uniref:neuroligin-4, X-linked isoform X2 n=1 Tax=Vespa velutina TaxID=202808 RepID=UPI001FB4A1A7|nr:neuroligin-4, X-linked isoform X2 [Vespa velutina]